MVERKQENVSNSQNVNALRCEVGVGLREQDKQDGTLRVRRCDWNGSERNETIFDCTGGKNVNLYTNKIQKADRNVGLFYV